MTLGHITMMAPPRQAVRQLRRVQMGLLRAAEELKLLVSVLATARRCIAPRVPLANLIGRDDTLSTGMVP